MKYRIKEQYGVFRIEEERQTEYSFMGYVTQRTTKWVQSINKIFPSFEEAVNYIPKLEAKYYYVEDAGTWSVKQGGQTLP